MDARKGSANAGQPTYLQKLDRFIREFGTDVSQGLFVKLALEVFLDLLFLKTAELADGTGKLDSKHSNRTANEERAQLNENIKKIMTITAPVVVCYLACFFPSVTPHNFTLSWTFIITVEPVRIKQPLLLH